MIVVYYGVNLSLSLPFCLSVSLSLFFFPPSSSSGLAIFLHLELSLFCLFSLPRPSVNLARTPSLSYLSFPSGLSISPLLLLLLLLRAILLCSRCSARRKYSLFAPPLDMAKEAICALLAILEHFFEAFSPLDLFFALAPFRPVPRPFPAFLHPDCRRFPPLPIPFLHRFQPIPSPARPLKSTSSRHGSHPSRRHPPVLSSSSELLSLSTSVTLRGRLPSPHRLSLRRLVAIARACPRLRFPVPGRPPP